jgi:hypothetical protein
VKKHH